MSKEIKIKFSTKYAEGSDGDRMYLIGEMNGNTAIRSYRIRGPFQGMSVRRARKRIIAELEASQNVYSTDTKQR